MDKRIIIDKQIIYYIKEIAFFNCSKVYCSECPVQSICDIKRSIKYFKLNFLEIKKNGKWCYD